MGDKWTDARAEFSALASYVYLNAAAASPIPRVVRAAIETFARETAEGGDAPWDGWIGRREEVRAAAARLLGAQPDEIAFTTNTSTGLNAIIDLLEGDGPVLSPASEFPTVTLPWVHRGVLVHFVDLRNGVPTFEDFAVGSAPHAATIALSHVQFSNGCRVDLAAFGAIKQHRRLIVSASQSAGTFPIDVRRSGIDALATAGHKWLCAGYGTGILFVSRDLLKRSPRTMGWLSVEDPFTFENRRYRLLTSAARYEQGCPAFGNIFALGAAVEFLLALDVAEIAARVIELNTYLTDRLQRAGIDILSPQGSHRSGSTLCEVPDPSGAVVFLRERRVLVTQKPEGLRVSTHFYNTAEDIDTAVNAIAEWVAACRRRGVSVRG